MRVVTIGISGPSCSGKTTISRVLQQLVKHSIVLYQDDFFKPESQIPIDPTLNLANWDCPEAIDFSPFIDTIKYIQQHGQLPEGYKSNEVSNTHDGSSHISLDQMQKWKQHKVNDKDKNDDIIWLIVDGFMLLSDQRVYSLLDYRLFVTASYSTLKKRREDRQGYHTLEGYWVDPPNYFDDIVWPEFLKQHQHIQGPHHEHQHLPTDYDPSITLINTDELSISQSIDKVVDLLWPSKI
ncbi:P-loop containing nucleoside triphosphate hydrolase protein [Cunninghamella echinulata]|nr:P-loop containing nucleoside triphosphate hydrolase protein [Cunninghamella echinulata]